MPGWTVFVSGAAPGDRHQGAVGLKQAQTSRLHTDERQHTLKEAFLSFGKWLEIALEHEHPYHLFSDAHGDAKPVWERERGRHRLDPLLSARFDIVRRPNRTTTRHD